MNRPAMHETAILEMHPRRSLYRIVSTTDLPKQMWGIYTFSEAYVLCCQWNERHDAAFKAWPELLRWKV